MTKYEIKQTPFPKYRGKFAELKLTLDQMKHGDSIVILKTEYHNARMHNWKQNKKNKTQYYLRYRKHTDPQFIEIWKFEEGVNPYDTNT